jgi:predicted nuclease of predicted toxin-antitoxin system
MTIWLDAHLNPRLAAWLTSRFAVVGKTLKEVGLFTADDHVIFDAARSAGDVVIMTKDADFAQLVQRLGPPPKVIWIRCGNLPLIEYQLMLTQSLTGALDSLNAGKSLVEISDP